MAGIGVRLKRIYEKQTLVAHLVGFAYSIMVTIAPMLVVIGTLFWDMTRWDMPEEGFLQEQYCIFSSFLF